MHSKNVTQYILYCCVYKYLCDVDHDRTYEAFSNISWHCVTHIMSSSGFNGWLKIKSGGGGVQT